MKIDPSKRITPQKIHSEKDVSIDFLKSWNNQGYEVKVHKKAFSILLLGELHEREELEQKQAELISLIKPEFVLHEFLKIWTYNSRDNSFDLREGVKSVSHYEIAEMYLGEISPIILDEIRKCGAKIIGCDLWDKGIKKAEREIAKLNPDVFYYDYRLRRFDDDDYICLISSDEIIPYRDKEMAKVMITYQKKSHKPIISILGNTHSKNIHEGKLLQRKGFGYAYINQTSNDIE